MHSSAAGAAARMVFRSFSSAARWSSLNAARYWAIVLASALGLGAMNLDGPVGSGIRTSHLPLADLGDGGEPLAANLSHDPLRNRQI